MLRIMKPVGTERTFMHKLALFLLSSGLKWLFSIIANPAGLMNNLGCDWAVPDGWNEMPPLAFHQLGEAVIPTGWWCSLFWISVIFEEPTKYRWVTHSSCWGRILTDTPLSLLSCCSYTGSRETLHTGTVIRWLPQSLPNLLRQDGAPGFPEAVRSKGGLRDVKSTGAQSPERGCDPWDGGAVAAAHTEPASAQWTQKWWGYTAATQPPQFISVGFPHFLSLLQHKLSDII